MSWSCSCILIVRPEVDAVHCSASGHPRQAVPKIALFFAVIVRVTPAGQVSVPASASWVKSSMVNPPSTAGRSGHGLSTGVHFLPSRVFSMSPVA